MGRRMADGTQDGRMRRAPRRLGDAAGCMGSRMREEDEEAVDAGRAGGCGTRGNAGTKRLPGAANDGGRAMMRSELGADMR